MLKKYVFLLSTLLLSSNAIAQWELVNDKSTINYVSTKASKVGEVNSFKKLNGTLKDTGELSLAIDLSSVETNIAIRNERVKTMLFDVASFSNANISANLDPKLFSELTVGESYQSTISFNLSLHGVSQQITTDIQVVKLAKNDILAFSLSPIIINANKYNLVAGIEKLREVANLPSISPVVPVSFSLVFKQQ
ncbi:YceI family protein [Colwellia sp. 4_MG-2023]|jgi:polyisoprenoid-binding protein YceI|uniref:YceI family protein n=1 Tax=unclassified Colwellia TaxID=196834 RepID=UPI001C086A3D|nr:MULTISPECIES: YceI family protein [unclassified Colwellia]MBU2924379.1 YceI family protein [Colwellia sp. C2M11]MDO6487241.1 YceI family protein [Colwellia sp. 6_MG-2023]MDO6505396.1 YceI family protein [Colwellia sp. 5_MG-2023]MDO6554308.1 YceI family protein [Colwellia sp. 4_MG-2023]MDO6650819.1 YceI family protein [Colwellia sp. 3_MG-2023]